MSSDTPNSLLMSALTKMFPVYMAQHTPKAVCEVITALNPSSNPPPCSSPIWSTDHALQQANLMMQSIKTQDDAIKLLVQIGISGVAVREERIPAMQACAVNLDLTTREYGYLWSQTPDSPFCRVQIGDGTINYSPIGRVKQLQGVPEDATQKAVGIIIDQYQAAITRFDPARMKDACQAQFTYADMSNVPFLQLCGCYIAVPDHAGFTNDEKQFVAQNPQCNPTCLSAPVRYVAGVGGTPVPCQQDTCIADAINVTGTTTSIAQVCPQCPKRFMCVCYIHVNGRTLDNQTCNTVYIVNDKGEITETIHNQAPPAGSGLKNGFTEMLHSKVTLIVLIVVAAVIAIVVVGVLIAQHLRGKTKAGARSIPQVRREPLGYAMQSM